MRSCFAIVNTDLVNKQNMRIPAFALVSALEQTRGAGTPMLISHDVHRPLGWTRAAGMQADAHRVALVAQMSFAETTAEEQHIGKMAQAYFARQHSRITPDQTQFREAACVLDPGIVRRKFPGLFSNVDKHGLVPIKPLKAIAPGVYEVGDGLCVFAHSYFRRSFSPYNNLNAPFLERLQAVAGASDLVFKIALDPDAVALRETYKMPIELAHWRGPKFTDDLTAIPAGVTRHEATDTLRHYHSIRCTEFWWHNQSGIQNLECEEVLENPAPGVSHEAYGCRYVHSMVDAGTQRPTHLDGAVRMYDGQGIMDRWDLDIDKAGKKSKYTKLWRVDGDLPIATWKELIGDYFRDNTLVGEYLSGHDETEIAEKAQEQPEYHLGVPLLKPEDGLEVFVSMVSVSPGPSVEVIPTFSVTLDDTDVPWIEFSALDLIKLMRRRGMAVEIPVNVALMAFEDRDINFPRIVHRGSTAGEDALRSVECLAELLTDVKNDDRNISVTLDVEDADGAMRYSLLGNAASFRRLRTRPFDTFVASSKDLGAWLERAKSACGDTTGSPHHDLTYLEEDGTYRLERPRIPWEMIVKIESGDIAISCSTDDQPLLSAVQARNSRAALVALVEKATCNRCQCAYQECGCCVLVDGGSVTVDKCGAHFYVWTERLA
jgi:hypothetical protein